MTEDQTTEQEIVAKVGSDLLARHPLFTDAPLAAITSSLDSTIEQEIQAKADNGPRVTPADIEAEIASEHYFTAAQGAAHHAAHNPRNFGDIGIPSLGLLTLCVLVLRNGFTVTGESACASPENFNAEIGRRIARENAAEKIWPLLGFRLRDELARPVLTEADAAADLAVKAKPEKLKSLGHGVTTTTSPHDVVGAKTRTPRDTWNKRLGHGVTMAEKTENLASMRVPAEFSPKVEKASHRTPRVPPLYVYQSKGQKGSADRHGSYMRLTAKPVHLFTGLLQRQSLATH